MLSIVISVFSIKIANVAKLLGQCTAHTCMKANVVIVFLFYIVLFTTMAPHFHYHFGSSNVPGKGRLVPHLYVCTCTRGECAEGKCLGESVERWEGECK